MRQKHPNLCRKPPKHASFVTVKEYQGSRFFRARGVLKMDNSTNYPVAWSALRYID